MTRRTTRLAKVGALVVLIATSACVATVDQRGRGRVEWLDADLTAVGREEFVSACAPCHGIDARGGGPVAAALRTAPSDLTKLAVRNGGHFPREYVIGVVTGDVALAAHGSRDMPVWSARFAPSDSGATAAASIHVHRRIEALISYLESVQRN
jgi:mono/diheme cytochrome c family protein